MSAVWQSIEQRWDHERAGRHKVYPRTLIEPSLELHDRVGPHCFERPNEVLELVDPGAVGQRLGFALQSVLRIQPACCCSMRSHR